MKIISENMYLMIAILRVCVLLVKFGHPNLDFKDQAWQPWDLFPLPLITVCTDLTRVLQNCISGSLLLLNQNTLILYSFLFFLLFVILFFILHLNDHFFQIIIECTPNKIYCRKMVAWIENVYTKVMLLLLSISFFISVTHLIA